MEQNDTKIKQTALPKLKIYNATSRDWQFSRDQNYLKKHFCTFQLILYISGYLWVLLSFSIMRSAK